MILRIPNKGQWTYSNAGEYDGSIIQTYNIDLYKKPGKVCVSDGFIPYTTSIEIPTGFVGASVDNTYQIWAKADKLYTTTAVGTTFTTDATSGSPTGMTDGDIVKWGTTSDGYDKLLVSTGTDLWFFNEDIGVGWIANWWTSGSYLDQTGFDSLSPTILVPFGGGSAIMIINDNIISSIGTSGTSATPTATSDVSYARYTAPANYYAVWARYANEKLYVGLGNNNTDDTAPTAVLEYDPISEIANLIQVDEGANIGWVQNNIIYIVDWKGSIRYYNGQSFADTGDKFPTAYQEGVAFPFPHRNGISVVEGKARFLISSDSVTMPSGIWTYDPNTGDPYLEYTMSPTASLGTSFGSVLDGNNDWGALYISSSTETMFAAAACYTSSSTKITGVFSNYNAGVDTIDNRGWFITPKIVSPDRESTFAKLLIRYDPQDYYLGVPAYNGEIVAKWRMANRTYTLAYETGTWTSGTTFTTSYSNIQVGNEIFVSAGYNSGVTAHVTNTSVSSGTYTITIDETVSTTSGTFKYTVDNWIKLNTEIGSTYWTNAQASNGYAQYVIFDIPPDIASTDWIQFKIEIRGAWYITGIQVGFEQSLVLIYGDQKKRR